MKKKTLLTKPAEVHSALLWLKWYPVVGLHIRTIFSVIICMVFLYALCLKCVCNDAVIGTWKERCIFFCSFPG